MDRLKTTEISIDKDGFESRQMRATFACPGGRDGCRRGIEPLVVVADLDGVEQGLDDEQRVLEDVEDDEEKERSQEGDKSPTDGGSPIFPRRQIQPFLTRTSVTTNDPCPPRAYFRPVLQFYHRKIHKVCAHCLYSSPGSPFPRPGP